MAHRSLIFILAALLAGCGPKLKHIPVSSAEYRAELSKQRQLAAELRQDRAARLDKVAGRIKAAARQLCEPLGGEKCSYPVSVDENEEINASADGKRVLVATGMMRFVANDDELAAIVGHEYAHNILEHMGTKHGNAWLIGFFGALLDVGAAVAGVNTHGVFMRAGYRAGSGLYSQGFEAEADTAGLYLAAVAGYDITRSAMLWRRFGAEKDSSREYADSHPSTPARFVTMEKVIREIEAKRFAGLPLVPDQKDDTRTAVAETNPAISETKPAILETEPAPAEHQQPALETTAAPAPIPMGIPAGMSMDNP